ncbi:mitochondrial folate transporter-like protein/carrier [Pseudovirgaria hyperparasitica]|uniref:Mitochondrial folate transporter-like protein/carrier n=1 Tax=Pseudovirgaria hyperparasitica TaxID=470096 RepID=A0A6A6WA80_9PEZI|nr:mitochondrial folate transporter-like protein/carrier [Pseudovirgaria hyperparasitica]KAF2759475.1 mitochondrial folate transporter-like protein/carrier [Pseudovirgaria hyperparasitica]
MPIEVPSQQSQHVAHPPNSGAPDQPGYSLFNDPHASLAKFTAKLPPSSINSFCGAMAGVASGIVTCPLDVIKTRLQSQGSFTRGISRGTPSSKAIYNGLSGTAKVIWMEDGLRGMYRGLGPMLLGYLPTWAVYMSVYDSSKDFYYTQVDNKWFARIYASVTAGACSTLATNPIWVIKTRLMSQVSERASKEHRTPWHYKSTFDAAKKMYRTEGFLAFYSGLTPALLGLTHVAIQFPLYEFFKMKFTGLEMGENTKEDHDVHWAGILGGTFLSKICATTATYPHEVLRTRLQTQQRSLPSTSSEGVSFRGSLGEPSTSRGSGTAGRASSEGVLPRAVLGLTASHPPGSASSDGMINLPRYHGVVKTFKTILAEEGWRAFYNGMGTNMVRAVPAAMTTMITYEVLKKACHRLQEEGQAALNEEP